MNSIEPIPGKKNLLITSALPYVNNVPHLGNLIGSVLSGDVYARFNRKRGHNVLYISGVDEYGTTTERKAIEEHASPKETCDKYYKLHSEIYQWFNIEFDYFGRTSTEIPSKDDWIHTSITHNIFQKLYDKGLTSIKHIEQLFCLDCNNFLADRYVKGICPTCQYNNAKGDQCDQCGKLINAIDLISPLCVSNPRHKVIIKSTDHIYLNLPAIQDQNLKWISNSNLSSTIINETTSFLKEVKERCISRDLKWGTPIPSGCYDGKFNDKVFYVWFDAPIGYISITANYTTEWKKWWLPNKDKCDVKLVQFMGSDNLLFHTVIFPSTLLGTGDNYILPDKISCCNHLNYEIDPRTKKPTKFSKSNNVGIFGDDAMKSGIDSDVWRYYLLAVRPETSETIFSWTDLRDKNNNELIKNLGNLVMRGLCLCCQQYKGVIPDKPEEYDLNDDDVEFISKVNSTLAEYNELMEDIKIKKSISKMMQLSHYGNVYVQNNRIWIVNKSDDQITDPGRGKVQMNIILNIIYLCALCAEPFIPNFSYKVYQQLNVSDSDSHIPDKFEFWLKAGTRINKPTPIFTKIKLDKFIPS